MTWLDYSIVGIYLLGLLFLGLRFRHQHSGQEYFLGGRSLPWPTLTLSVSYSTLRYQFYFCTGLCWTSRRRRSYLAELRAGVTPCSDHHVVASSADVA